MAKVIKTFDNIAAGDVIQFFGDTEATLWTCSLNALNPATMFNEICLVSWGDGQVLHFVNEAGWSSKYQVWYLGTISTDGIIFA